jgi:tetratricopeptide (TPR) repeat protein
VADRRRTFASHGRRLTVHRPIAIDDTSEAQARVPDRFREVQWMRLGKESPESIAARVGKLLAGEAAPSRAESRSERKRSPLRYIGAGIAIVLALAAIIVPLVRPKSDRDPPTASANSATEASRLAHRALDVVKSLDYTREGLTAAAESARKASELDPSLALAWGARARVDATWLYRVWDTSEERRRTAQEFARRALAIDRTKPTRFGARDMVLEKQDAFAEAERCNRRALKSAAGRQLHSSFAGQHRALPGPGGGCDRHRKGNARQEILEIPRALRPRVALCDASMEWRGLREPDLAMDHFDRSIETKPAAFRAPVEGQISRRRGRATSMRRTQPWSA